MCCDTTLVYFCYDFPGHTHPYKLFLIFEGSIFCYK